MSDTVDWWSGSFGDEYTERNAVTGEAIRAREQLWSEILTRVALPTEAKILEVGANVGVNLRALRKKLWAFPHLFAVEPNDKARWTLVRDGDVRVRKSYSRIDQCPAGFDLIFTSGVMIHVPPDELKQFCQAIYDRANRYIVAIEYFSAEPREVEYRGHAGRLWTRDFGSFWLDNFPDLTPVACGFAWKRLTGLDNLTYWILEKQ